MNVEGKYSAKKLPRAFHRFLSFTYHVIPIRQVMVSPFDLSEGTPEISDLPQSTVKLVREIQSVHSISNPGSQSFSHLGKPRWPTLE